MGNQKIEEIPLMKIVDLVRRLYLADADLDTRGKDARIFPPPVELISRQTCYFAKTGIIYNTKDNNCLDGITIARTF